MCFLVNSHIELADFHLSNSPQNHIYEHRISLSPKDPSRVDFLNLLNCQTRIMLSKFGNNQKERGSYPHTLGQTNLKNFAIKPPT